MTTTPSIATVCSMWRIASTAAWSADSFSPLPIQRPAPIAAASVTRTSSSARFRSGAAPATAGSYALHAFGRDDADQIQRPGDDYLRRAAEAESKGLRLAAFEHAVVMVEAMEIVGEVDGVVGELMRGAPLGRLCDDGRELDESFDQGPLLGRQLCRRVGPDGRVAGVAHDSGDPRRRILDVVDGVLLGLLGREVDVDLDRLVVAPRDEVPARGFDADLVHELVQRDDVAGTLGHLRELASSDQVDELV